ncbi:MAG: class I SAM-dependent methyltransferase [Kofleriaceae bacterium]
MIGERSWSILHTDAIITYDDEKAFLRKQSTTKRPYGVALWPAALALAHDLAGRDLAGKRVLELGAGTGLPGIVAAARGARVVQTDKQKLALHVCEMNAARNLPGGTQAIEHRLADWTMWADEDRYDVIVGADILYTEFLHPFLRSILQTSLAAGGTALVADPFRRESMPFFELMEADGWQIAIDKWTVGIAPPPRTVGVFALARGG